MIDMRSFGQLVHTLAVEASKGNSHQTVIKYAMAAVALATKGPVESASFLIKIRGVRDPVEVTSDDTGKVAIECNIVGSEQPAIRMALLLLDDLSRDGALIDRGRLQEVRVKLLNALV